MGIFTKFEEESKIELFEASWQSFGLDFYEYFNGYDRANSRPTSEHTPRELNVKKEIALFLHTRTKQLKIGSYFKGQTRSISSLLKRAWRI